MGLLTKKYIDFFQETEAGMQLLKDIDSLSRSEYASAADCTDMQESFAHLQRAKGIQMALNKIQSSMMGAKKPM